MALAIALRTCDVRTVAAKHRQQLAKWRLAAAARKLVNADPRAANMAPGLAQPRDRCVGHGMAVQPR